MSKAISTFQVKITFTQNLSNVTHLTPYNLTTVASCSVNGLLNAQIFCSLKCIICVGFPFVVVFSKFAKKKDLSWISTSNNIAHHQTTPVWDDVISTKWKKFDTKSMHKTLNRITIQSSNNNCMQK